MKFNGFYNGIDAITFPNTFFWTRQQNWLDIVGALLREIHLLLSQ
jgi:hypothetical protein